MLWRLQIPIRSLALSTNRRFKSHLASSSTSDALKILFCGSDNFSIASLRALVAAKRYSPGLIDSIHVVHRPAKPTGRGLKELRQVPIQQVAEDELKLPTSAIDTFTGWTPPMPVDLIIAVSFGLFVPPRILSTATYGGLNVHPSLLPDLKGPAPIQHAILRQRQCTGVSIQTLDPTHFDRGIVLAQSAKPGVAIRRDTTAMDLTTQLADEGAAMLVNVLEDRMYVPRLQDSGWYADTGMPQDHAPKITKQDRFIDLENTSVQDVLIKHHALGDLWCLLPDGQRLTINEIQDAECKDDSGSPSGIFAQEGYQLPILRDMHGHNAIIIKSTLAGGPRFGAGPALLRTLPKLGSNEGPIWAMGKQIMGDFMRPK